jgi:hypothetical protein
MKYTIVHESDMFNGPSHMARRARVTGVAGGLPVPRRTAFTVGGNGTSSNGSGMKDAWPTCIFWAGLC